jgi:hypothetical protein
MQKAHDDQPIGALNAVASGRFYLVIRSAVAAGL